MIARETIPLIEAGRTGVQSNARVEHDLCQQLELHGPQYADGLKEISTTSRNLMEDNSVRSAHERENLTNSN